MCRFHYSQITPEIESKIVERYHLYRKHSKNKDPIHAAAKIAVDVFQLTESEYYAEEGADAYAAVLTYCVTHNLFGATIN